MKSFIYCISVLLLCAVSFARVSAQSEGQNSEKTVITTQFPVSGVCLMCKERIENAALIKGVKFAEWDLDSGILKVVYKDWKTSESAIHEALAEQGHETEKVKCTDEQYGQLHACCRYRSVDGEQ